MSRYFANFPALRTMADVEAEMALRQASRAVGFQCIDGLRMLAEIPEHVASALIDEAARRVERDAAELAKIADGWQKSLLTTTENASMVKP
jgi:hypothetical protein